MSPRLGTLLDWILVDVIVLGIAIQQYISISRDLKRSRADKDESDNTNKPK